MGRVGREGRVGEGRAYDCLVPTAYDSHNPGLDLASVGITYSVGHL
jgi:hypothetical protein